MKQEIDQKVQGQLRESVDMCLERLEEKPDDPFALWALSLLSPHCKYAPAGLRDRLETYAGLRKEEDDEQLVARLRETNARAFAEDLWTGLHALHYDGALLTDLARWLVLLVTDDERLAELAWVPSAYNPGWEVVGRTGVVAVEMLARAALERDPENESALSFYADESFLKVLNRGRKKADCVTAPPVPKRPPAHWVAKVDGILDGFERGESALGLFVQMDLVPVDHADIVRRLIAGLSGRAWRGQTACCEALGRATVSKDLAIEALSAMLGHEEEGVRERAAEALGRLRGRR